MHEKEKFDFREFINCDFIVLINDVWSQFMLKTWFGLGFVCGLGRLWGSSGDCWRLQVVQWHKMMLFFEPKSSDPTYGHPQLIPVPLPCLLVFIGYNFEHCSNIFPEIDSNDPKTERWKGEKKKKKKKNKPPVNWNVGTSGSSH